MPQSIELCTVRVCELYECVCVHGTFVCVYRNFRDREHNGERADRGPVGESRILQVQRKHAKRVLLRGGRAQVRQPGRVPHLRRHLTRAPHRPPAGVWLS